MSNSEREKSVHWCIFEKKICPLAKKEGPAFECTAKSDAEMACK